MKKAIKKAIAVDITVASPAPKTPIPKHLIPKKGNSSNISIGYNTIFEMAAIIIIIIGFLESPIHLNAVFIVKEENIIGRKNILMYQ